MSQNSKNSNPDLPQIRTNTKNVSDVNTLTCMTPIIGAYLDKAPAGGGWHFLISPAFSEHF